MEKEEPDSEPAYIKDLIERFLDGRKNARGKLLFAMLAGSFAFNLNVETSDKDYFAVYAGNTYDTASLAPPSATVDSHDPDVACHEAEKFCTMLLKGNPKVIEPLYAHKYCYVTEEWKELQKIRGLFLTQNTVNQYVGYGLAQIKELDRGKGLEKAPKKYYHCLRILQDAERIAKGNEPLVWLEGESRDYLMKVRKNKIALDQLRAKVNNTVKQIDAHKDSLAKNTDGKQLSDWLVYVRRKNAKISERIEEERELSEQEEELLSRAKRVLEKEGVVGDILCCVPSGSVVHGLGSGKPDYIAVYAATTDSVMSLRKPAPLLHEDEVEGRLKLNYASGLILVEVGHAVAQLSKGCFRLVELLFTTRKITQVPLYESHQWLQLKEIRSQFLVGTTLRNASGIAKGQLKNPSAKGTYHALRLLTECQAIVTQGSPYIKIPEGERRTLLQKAKAAKVADTALVSKADHWFTETISQLSSVPKKMETLDKCNEWLENVRSRRWTREE